MPNTEPINREPWEETFINLMSNPKYVKQSFWSFVVAKMQVKIDRSVPTAGAGFFNNNYQLIINPDFFNPLPLEQRFGLIIHECLHVVLKHIFRKGERDHKLFNIACDIAINQSIPRLWLPEGAMLPETFKDENGTLELNKTAEVYYEWLKEEKERQEQEKQEQECDSDSQGQGQSQDQSQDDQDDQSQEDQDQGSNFKPENGNPDLTGQEEMTLDSHEFWDDINPEDEELAQQIMENILDSAQERARGNTPSNIEDIMDLWKRKPRVSWKKVLKKYISSKKGSKVSTIKRRDRRQPHRVEVKGKKTSYDRPEVIVFVDISGSMSQEDIVKGLTEINEVCKLTGSDLRLIQIDTEIKGLEKYTHKLDFKRLGSGGTYLGNAPHWCLENKEKADVSICITDGFIEDVSKDPNWKNWARKTPTIFLSTTGKMTPVNKKDRIFNISDS